jgi:hypothetical protein
MRIEERKEKQLRFGAENSIFMSGAIHGSLSGALDPRSKEAEKHAETYYAAVRNMKDDVKTIARNTGFSEEQVKNIKDHLFMSKHDLGKGEPEYFAPDFDITQSWQRLIDGKNIEPHDIILLQHELLEREYMSKGFTQEAAHRKTEEEFNYAKPVKERYRNGLARKDEKR